MSAKRSIFKERDLFLNGEYRLMTKLGEGGMGQVWAAIELYSGNVVAIKMLHNQGPNFVLRFRQECRFYTKLRHPNIVSMFKAGEDENGIMYIIMDLLAGKTVRKVLQTSTRLQVLPALHLAIQFADAGAYMHRKGVWHRDLKPENLMVGTQDDWKGHLWLFDFGIARFANAEDQGLVSDELPDVGTVRYMAPEQVDLRNRRAVDGRADIYAFGVILYEILTGRHIFVREKEPTTAAQIMHGHLVATVKPIPSLVADCPEDLWELVKKCLAKDPSRRIQRFDEIATALRGMIRGSLPPDHYIARRIKQEVLHAARVSVFSDVDMGEDREAALPRPGAADTDPHKRKTVPGEYPGVAAEVALYEGETRSMRATPIAATPASSRDEPDPDAATVEVPREVRATEPMAPAFVPPERVLPFTEGPSSAMRGKGYTVRMASASALLARGVEVSSHRGALEHAPVLSEPEGAAELHSGRPATSSTSLSPIATMTMQSPPPPLRMPRTRPVGAAPRRNAYVLAILAGMLVAMTAMGAVVALRRRPVTAENSSAASTRSLDTSAPTVTTTVGEVVQAAAPSAVASAPRASEPPAQVPATTASSGTASASSARPAPPPVSAKRSTMPPRGPDVPLPRSSPKKDGAPRHDDNPGPAPTSGRLF